MKRRPRQADHALERFQVVWNGGERRAGVAAEVRDQRRAELANGAVRAVAPIVLVMRVIDARRRTGRQAEARTGLDAPGAERMVADEAVAPRLERARRRQRNADPQDRAVAASDAIVVIAQPGERDAAGRSDARADRREHAAIDLTAGAAVIVVAAAAADRRTARRRWSEAARGREQHRKAWVER